MGQSGSNQVIDRVSRLQEDGELVRREQQYDQDDSPKQAVETGANAASVTGVRPLIRQGDWFRPAHEGQSLYAARMHLGFIAQWLPHVARRGVCVQAGGSLGLFPDALSRIFERIYTFEPDPTSFTCLTLNCTAGNVVKFQAALGSTRSFMGMHQIEDNSSAAWMEGEGLIPVIPLDDLRLPGCDMLQLDVEGFELDALIGGENTIRKYRPTLVLEDRGFITRAGHEPEDLHNYLDRLGYRQVAKVHKDTIWIS